MKKILAVLILTSSSAFGSNFGFDSVINGYSGTMYNGFATSSAYTISGIRNQCGKCGNVTTFNYGRTTSFSYKNGSAESGFSSRIFGKIKK